MTAHELKQLNAIIKQCDKISHYLIQSQASKDTFFKDEMVFDAIAICLIQIGESVNKLSVEFKNQHVSVNWHQIRGLRNRMTHDYEGVSIQMLWTIVSKNIPELRNAIHSLLLANSKTNI